MSTTTNQEKPSWLSSFFTCLPKKKATNDVSSKTDLELSDTESIIDNDKKSLELTIVYEEPARQARPLAELEVCERPQSPVTQKRPENGEFLRKKFNSQLVKSLQQSKKPSIADLASIASPISPPEAEIRMDFETQSSISTLNNSMASIDDNSLSRACTVTEEMPEMTIIQVGLVAEGPVSREILAQTEPAPETAQTYPCLRSNSVRSHSSLEEKALPALPKALKKKNSLSQMSRRIFSKTENAPRPLDVAELPEPIPVKRSVYGNVYDGRQFKYGSTFTVETLYVDDDRSVISDWSLNSTNVPQEDRPARRGTLRRVRSSLASMRVSSRQ